MILCRFDNNRLGVIRDDTVIDVTETLEALPAHRYPLPDYDPLIAHLPDLLPRIAQATMGKTGAPVSDVRLASPVANPGKVLGAPVNYRDHVEEMLADPTINRQLALKPIEQAGLFLKANSSVIGTGDPILVRYPDRRTDHEVELAVVIGRKADRIAREDALSFVAGYCIGLDITTRGPEDRSMRKSSDTYTVLGPWLVTADELPAPSRLDLSLSVNGLPRQQSNTRNLIMDIPSLIAYASRCYTLMPGDVILTGTPGGVGPIKAGDIIRSAIAGIGAMTTLVGDPPA